MLGDGVERGLRKDARIAGPPHGDLYVGQGAGVGALRRAHADVGHTPTVPGLGAAGGGPVTRRDYRDGMDEQYERLLRHVRETGTPKSDRTGTGTLSDFGQRLDYDLAEGFPLITTKRVHFRSIADECCGSCAGTATSAGCASTA